MILYSGLKLKMKKKYECIDGTPSLCRDMPYGKIVVINYIDKRGYFTIKECSNGYQYIIDWFDLIKSRERPLP